MHNLESGPVAHGDIKLVSVDFEIISRPTLADHTKTNVLVTSDETALICDFGRSRQGNDRPNEVMLSNSSQFAGTVRYMSPELLVPELSRPSPTADMWAYGCIALEVRIRKARI
jgi:serine/threonine protein kinase